MNFRDFRAFDLPLFIKFMAMYTANNPPTIRYQVLLLIIQRVAFKINRLNPDYKMLFDLFFSEKEKSTMEKINTHAEIVSGAERFP